MNPVWSVFFKDRFKTPFSIYKMSFAELVFLAAAVGAAGYGLGKVVKWVVDFETTPVVIEQTK